MVTVDRGKISMNGDLASITADATCLLKGLFNILCEETDEEFARGMLNHVLEMALEFEKENKKKPENESNGKKKFSKYKKGQKLQVEIAEVHTHYTDDGKPYNLYRIKGFNTLTFDDYGLDRLVSLAKEDK